MVNKPTFLFNFPRYPYPKFQDPEEKEEIGKHQNGSMFAKHCERRQLLIFLDQVWHFSTIFDNMDQCLLSIVKDDNPWDVSSLYDFNYYCCPECDSKSQNKQDFINHASNNHPWVSKCCFLGTSTGYLMAKCIS